MCLQTYAFATCLKTTNCRSLTRCNTKKDGPRAECIDVYVYRCIYIYTYIHIYIEIHIYIKLFAAAHGFKPHVCEHLYKNMCFRNPS